MSAETGLVVTSPGGAGVPATLARRPLPYTTIYVDPANGSGHASDANPGTSPSAPIATTAGLNAINFCGSLTANTLAQYLTEDAGGAFFDPSTLALGPFTYTVTLPRQVLHTGGTLNAGTTAINPAANQAQLVHTSDLADFAPLLFTGAGGSNAHWTRLTDTATTAGAWLYFGAGSATAETSRAVLPNGSAGALTSGDAYQVTRGGAFALAATAFPASSGGTLVFNDCEFSASSGGPLSVGSFSGSVPTFNRCAFLGALNVSGNFNDCAAAFGMQGPLIVSLSAGVLIPSVSTDEMPGSLNISGDTVITGQSLFIAGTFVASLFISAGIGAGIQFQRGVGLTVGAGGAVVEGGALGGSIWGHNNVGLGIGVSEGGTCLLPAARVPTVTGTLGAFGFYAGGGALTVARAWDETAGAYTTPRATTWANFAATLGAGGLNFQAHDVATGASLVGV